MPLRRGRCKRSRAVVAANRRDHNLLFYFIFSFFFATMVDLVLPSPTPPLQPPPPPSVFAEPLLELLRAKVTLGLPVRVYCDGVFDLLHYGHSRALEQARAAASAALAAACGGGGSATAAIHLTVGVCTDADVAAYKGAAPVLSYAERVESLRHCRWVDAVLPAPWVPTPTFLDAHGLDVLAHDALPYADLSGFAAGGDCYAAIKTAGRFLPTQRTDGVSTTDILARVLARGEELGRKVAGAIAPPPAT